MSIRLGTCSWADKSLLDSGRFYPRRTMKSEERLAFYARTFPTVEVDTSYYAIPLPETTTRWAACVGGAFTFHVKAFRLFTGHWAEMKVLPPDLRDDVAGVADQRGRLYLKDVPEGTKDALWERFAQALEPLRLAGKTGVVLFQFAPWIGPLPRVNDHIDECLARLPGHQLAVEFRNDAWFARDRLEETLGFLRHRRIVYACVDEPQGFKSSVPPVIDVTGPEGYVRFHGRNRAMWEAKTASSPERFDYWYEERDLDEWLPRIEFLNKETDRVNLLFNTNRLDQGPQNARKMADALMDAGLAGDIDARDHVLGVPVLPPV